MVLPGEVGYRGHEAKELPSALLAPSVTHSTDTSRVPKLRDPGAGESVMSISEKQPRAQHHPSLGNFKDRKMADRKTDIIQTTVSYKTGHTVGTLPISTECKAVQACHVNDAGDGVGGG